MKSKLLTGILTIIMIVLVAASASAITFLTYCRDMETKDPIGCDVSIGSAQKHAAGQDSQASFILSANRVYEVKYSNDAEYYKYDIDPIFLDDHLYYCIKGKDCENKVGNFQTKCDWDDKDNRWYCSVEDNKGNIIYFVYMGKENGVYKAGRVNFIKQDQAPQVTPIQAQTIAENGRFTYQIRAADPDGDTVHYELDNAPAGMTVSASGLIEWTPSFDDEGTYTVDLTVRDYYIDVPLSFDITVTKTNRVPYFTQDPSIDDSITYRTDDTIICIDGDVDDDDIEDAANLQLSYRWYINENLVSGETTSTLDCSAVSGCDKGVEIQCGQTVTDGDLTSAEALSNSITVENTAPQFTNIAVTDPVYTNSTITCTASGWSDADNDAEGYVYEWDIDGSIVSGETADTFDCDAAAGCDKDTVVTCTATADDGEDLGNSLSASVTISNTAPSISSVAITPDPAYTDDLLTCTPDGWNDIDNDAEGYNYEWDIDGSIVSGETADTFDCDIIAGCDKNSVVTCTVTPDDGDDLGTAVSSSVTIQNTPPSISSVAITPDPAYTDDTLTCTPNGWNDIDGDTESYDYIWFDDGSEIAGEISDTLDLTLAGLDKHNEIICQATPDDGDDLGTPLNGSVTISNSAPQFTTVTITDPAYTSSVILCNASGWADADGDTEAYDYEWDIDGSIVSGETADTFDCDAIAGCDKDAVVTCTATANDGEDLGNSLSASVTISNTLPVLTTMPYINNTAPQTNDVILCVEGNYSDLDNDAQASSSFRWMENGVEIVGETLQTLDLAVAGLDKDDIVACEQMVNDGTDDSLWYSSANITVGNTAPAFDFPLANQTIDEDTALSYDIDASDADNDTLTFYVNDTNFSIDSDGILSWTIIPDWNGVFDLTITISDGMVNVSEQMSVIVNPVNDAPRLLANISDITWPEDTVDTSLNLSQYWMDIENDPISYTSTAPADVAVDIDNLTGIVTLTPAGNFTGLDSVIFTATDGTDSADSNVVALNVTPVNDAPNLVSDIPMIAWPEDTNTTVDLTPYFTDIDGDLLTYTSTAPSNVIVFIDNLTGIATLVPELDFNGIDEVIFTAHDPDGLTADSNSVVLNITEENDAPVITSTPVTLTFEDELYTYDVEASDVDGDNLTYSLAINPDPANMTINPSTGLIEWTPANAFVGNNSITIQVDDGRGMFASQLFTVEVINVNDAPVITTLTPPNATEDVLYTFDFDANDDDLMYGDALLWILDGSVGSIDSSTGVFTWTPTNDNVGDNSFTIHVSDSEGAEDTLTFTINVINTNDAPTASNIVVTPLTPKTTDNLVCSFDVEDEDIGEYLAYADITWYRNGVNVNDNDTTMTPVLLNGPYSDHMVISEVNYHNTVGNQDEYVELFNPTSQAIVINSSWRVQDKDGSDPLCYGIIPPGGHYLIADDGGAYAAMADCAMPTIGGFGLANAGDSVSIYDAANNLVDGVGWGTETVEGSPAPVVVDASITRSPYEYSDSNDNSADFVSGLRDPQSTSNPKLDLDSSLTAKGEEWYCEVTVYNRFGGSNTFNSTSVIVENTLPTVTNVTITPDPANEADTLFGNGTYFDADSDPSASTFRWFVNGFEVAGETTQNLAPANFAEGDTVTFEYTPHDGEDAGTPVRASIFINSIPPVVTINAPLDGSNHNTHTIALNVSTNEDALCRYELNNTVSGTITTVPSIEHIGSLDTAEDGTFNLTVYCDDAMASTGQASVIINVDTVAPVITIQSPVASNVYAAASVDLNVSTDESADCDYSLNSAANVSLYVADVFGSANIVASHGSNTVVISCADSFGNSNTASVTFEADLIPPAAITDLAAAALNETAVQLTWTAVGDDGALGTAASYMIKQSNAPITTQGQFDAAVFAVGSESLVPLASGSAETFIVTGLIAGNTYHFAVEAVDDVDHVSGLGNTDFATPSTHDVSVNTLTHDKIGTTLYIRDNVQFTANIGNSGSVNDTITVELKENGVTIDTETITLASGANQDVAFNYTLPTESFGTRYSVEASISEFDSDTSDNYLETFIDTWSVRNRFSLDWVDLVNYPNANEAAAPATFYAWAKIENDDVNDFNNMTVTIDTDSLAIVTNQNGNTAASKTYSPFEGYDINTFWWEITSGSAETRSITVSIGNPGDDIVITRSVTFP